MRPLGITLIAVYHWLRACLLGVLGLLMFFAGGLASRFLSSMEDNPRIGAILGGLGIFIGLGALLFAVLFVVLGIGIWTAKKLGPHCYCRVISACLAPGSLRPLTPEAVWIGAGCDQCGDYRVSLADRCCSDV